MSNNESKTQLTNGSLIAYGGLALPLAITDLPIILYLPAFYAKEVGLSIGMVGLVFLLARLWDGISDLVVGALSDCTSSRFGRRKPWVMAGTPLLMAAIWFLCNPPEQVGLFYLFLWAIVFYTSQTIVTVPYWSWGAELSSNYEERSRITGFREGGSMIGNVIVAAAPVLLLANDAPVRDVLFLITGLIIFLIPLTTIPLVIAVKDPQRATVSKFQYSQLLNALRENRPMQLFLMVMMCNYLGIGVINSVAIFLIDIGFGLPGAFFSLFLIQYIAAIISVPLVIKLSNRFSKHWILAGAFAITSVYYLALFTLPMGNYYLLASLICIVGVTFSCSLVLSTSILADIVDYDTESSGEERAGIYMALFNLAIKVSLAVGVGLAYGFLDIIGFDPAAATHTTEDIFKIRLTACVPTSALLIPAALIIWKFPITKSVQRELRRKIENNAVNSKQGDDTTHPNQLKNPQHTSALSHKSPVTTLLTDND